MINIVDPGTFVLGVRTLSLGVVFSACMTYFLDIIFYP